MQKKVYPASEVAFALRMALGPIRAWDDCLSDMRRGSTNVDGHVLLPTCRMHDGRAWRPGYDANSVVVFINAVRATNPNCQNRAPLAFKLMDIDPRDTRNWRQRRLREGVSGASMHASGTTYRRSSNSQLFH